MVICIFRTFDKEQKDDAPKYAAIAISLFVAIKTIYDVLDKESEKRKKAEEGKESLELTVCPAKAPVAGELLGLTVYNNGKTPVSILSITLMLGTQSQPIREVRIVDDLFGRSVVAAFDGGPQHLKRIREKMASYIVAEPRAAPSRQWWRFW